MIRCNHTTSPSPRRYCDTWNEITSAHCSQCEIEINSNKCKRLLESAQSEEVKRSNIIFWKACTNFHSATENLNLLFYGYIHFQVMDIKLYLRVPMDIIKACIVYAYDINTLNAPIPISDSFVSYDQYDGLEFFANDTILKWRHNFNKGIVYGRNKVSVRRMWKVKVIDYDQSTPIDFTIGIKNVPSFFKDSRRRVLLEPVAQRNFAMQCMTSFYSAARMYRYYEGTMRFEEINVGDIITVLVIDKRKVLFKCNEKFVGDIDISGQITDNVVLMIEINCGITLELLQS